MFDRRYVLSVPLSRISCLDGSFVHAFSGCDNCCFNVCLSVIDVKIHGKTCAFSGILAFSSTWRQHIGLCCLGFCAISVSSCSDAFCGLIVAVAEFCMKISVCIFCCLLLIVNVARL